MQKILLVKMDKNLGNKIATNISSKFDYECETEPTLALAKQKIKKNNNFLLIIFRLDILESKNKKIIDFLIAVTIPVILVTDGIDDNLWDQIKQKNVIDYIIKSKNDLQTIADIEHIIHRVRRNQNITILIVDDSKISRMLIKELLLTQRFIILEASNGRKALEVLKKNTSIKLIIVDYNMPEMDGFELTASIREQYSKEEMAIIGISAYGAGIVSAKFLKQGANDFILKPYSNEEFCWRINQNLEMLEYIDIIRETANIDYLTNLYNRRYFFELGRKMFANAERKNINLTISMIDIDNFKSINDSYGHDFGDTVIKQIAAILRSRFRKTDIIARFGGDEFCVLGINMGKENAGWIFEEIRKIISEKKISIIENMPEITVSIGVITKIVATFEDTIKKADILLYKAKKAGRNCVMIK
ncbi:MAG: diguanylate cyclase [Spirochaetales bacterium]|nr:diguanylate cyclase [Spirochaetales bacterium]